MIALFGILCILFGIVIDLNEWQFYVIVSVCNSVLSYWCIIVCYKITVYVSECGSI